MKAGELLINAGPVAESRPITMRATASRKSSSSSSESVSLFQSAESLLEDLDLHGLATQKTFELADAVLELAGFRSRNDFLVGSNGLLAAFAHQPSPPEYQARREPMATGNIADRHARLHRLGDNGELLIHREPPPAGDAGDHFNL